MIQQISVFMENRKGTLSEITRTLAQNGVNLRAISIAESSDYGVLRLIADDANKATSTLLNQGFIVSLNPVTVIGVKDEPAGLSQLLALLAQGGIDIEYMYSLFTHQNGKAYMVFRVKDYEPLKNLLAEHGMEAVTPEELGLC